MTLLTNIKTLWDLKQVPKAELKKYLKHAKSNPYLSYISYGGKSILVSRFIEVFDLPDELAHVAYSLGWSTPEELLNFFRVRYAVTGRGVDTIAHCAGSCSLSEDHFTSLLAAGVSASHITLNDYSLRLKIRAGLPINGVIIDEKYVDKKDKAACKESSMSYGSCSFA